MARGYWRTLNVQPGSGLTFPWTEYISEGGSVADVSLGSDGVAQGMAMLVYWSDLPEVVQQLLGYSTRVVTFTQDITGATNAAPIVITSNAHGLNTGDVVTISGVLGNTNANGSWSITRIDADTFSLVTSRGNAGYTAATGSFSQSTLHRIIPWRHPYWTQLWCTRISSIKNIGPTGNIIHWPIPAKVATGLVSGSPNAEYVLALLTLQFTRPNYIILADKDIVTEADRYLDKFWHPNVQMLSREGQSFTYAEGNTPPQGKAFPGSVGQKLGHMKLKRTWHQIPQEGIYDTNGMPTLLAGFLGFVSNSTFLGMPTGTALCDAIEITPMALQLPAELMGIDSKYTQNQFDVSFNFDYFDPPLGPTATTRGHNTMPWAGDGLWYRVVSRVNSQPPFQTREFSSMFKII